MVNGMTKFFCMLCAALICTFITGSTVWKKYKEKYEADFAKEKENVAKFIAYYDLFTRWIALDQEGRRLKDFFEENHYKSVAVYGMKEAGELLYHAIKDCGLDAVYAVDRAPERLNLDLDIRKTVDEIPDVDVIVVTPIHYFASIQSELSNLTTAAIISIEDVIWGI